MNKKQMEKLYNNGNLSDGFNTLLKELIIDFENKYSNLSLGEKLAIEDVKKEYSVKRKVIEKKEEGITKKLKEYLKMIEKYSTFELDILGGESIMDILTDITSLFKGEQYDWGYAQNINRNQEYLMVYPVRFDDIDFLTNTEELIKEGTILDFHVDDLGDDRINFYAADTKGSLFASMSIGFKTSDNSKKHAFILEFIDLVVKYRMEKKSDDISFIELKRLEQAFIYSKHNEIDALNRKRAQDEREELEKRIEERDALLDKYIEDNFDIIDELPSEVALGNVTSAKVLKKLIEKYNETCEE